MTDYCYHDGPSPEFYKRITDCTKPCYPPQCSGTKGLVNKRECALTEIVRIKMCVYKWDSIEGWNDFFKFYVAI